MKTQEQIIIEKQQEIIVELSRLIPFIKNGLTDVGDTVTVQKIEELHSKIKEL